MSNNAGILPRWRPPSVPKLTNKAVDRVRNQFGGLNLRPERIRSQRLRRAHGGKMDTGERASKQYRYPCPVVLRCMPIIHDRLACSTELATERLRKSCPSILMTYEARLTKEQEGQNHSTNVHPRDEQYLASSTSMDSTVT